LKINPSKYSSGQDLYKLTTVRCLNGQGNTRKCIIYCGIEPSLESFIVRIDDFRMRVIERQFKTSRQRKDFDYNNPTRKCIICYTLSSWHCYECETDFCEKHFHDESHKKICKI